MRVFDKAETADRGEALNFVRREARLSRRRLRRRAQRLRELTRLLCRFGVIEDRNFFRVPRSHALSPWLLRKQGLERPLNAEEWARVIYHLCKHRGFFWGSGAEERCEADSNGEDGRVRRGLAATAALMGEKGYRSAAEMILSEFPESQRNKRGDYGKALSRRLLGKEFSLLFARQREFGNPFASVELEALILGSGNCRSGLFWRQKSALRGEDLLRMIGKCTFEHTEYRAPKAAFTAERHVWLTRLRNLRIFVAGRQRPLSREELEMALPLPYRQRGALSYKQLRCALIGSGLLQEPFVFAGLPDAGGGADQENAVLIALPGWQTIRFTLEKAGLENEWRQMAGAAVRGDPSLLDDIAWALSVYKDGDEVARELSRLMLPGGEKTCAALLGIRFDKFHALSLKALRRIVPHMEQGLRFDEACERAGYHHSRPRGNDEAGKYLPPFYRGRDRRGRLLFAGEADMPRNPVVLRALNQARKVVNAIVKRYGAPLRVHIEMARDLSRSFEERQRIVRAQNVYREQNDYDKARFAECFGRAPKGREFEKWRLFREQQGKCAYSLEPLELHRLPDDDYVEIDHILPYSRSFDDSRNNRVLVFVKENRDKGNLTPFEYLGGAHDSPRWRRFAAFVSDNKGYRQAKRQRLLRRDFNDAEAGGFRERNLNDTRYICRFFKSYVERHLRLAENDDAGRCVVVSGQLTSFLRARWGLRKVRGDSDRHHALDAAVVAVCSYAMIRRLAGYSRYRELQNVRDGYVDPVSGEIVDAQKERRREAFPEPWPHFRRELEMRLGMDNPARPNEEPMRPDSLPAKTLHVAPPLFVSRAPQRRNGGAAHKDTVYARPARFADNDSVTQKIPLSRLRLKDMDRLVDPERNAKLYAAIRARLEAYGGSGERAFPPGSELRKPDRDGNPTGPLVRSVTAVISKLSGIPVRGGIAENGNMLRVDVFSKGARFFLVPVYVHHRASGLPDRAVAAGKREAEWPRVDDSYTWCFSLYPNDLVRVTSKRDSVFGYYAGCDRATGAISIWTHDRDRRVGKNGLIRGVGVKTALALEKFDVDVLGRIFPARPEIRRKRA